MNLKLLNLSNNMLMGSIPKFKADDVTFSSNSFCQSTAGAPCSPQVNTLLDFLQALNYPSNLASHWTGNDQCKGPWLGLSCNTKGEVTIINLQKQGLSGTLSPSLANLPSLVEIHLGGNHMSGTVPTKLSELKSLRLLDISANNFQPPLPKFPNSVTDGNPLLVLRQVTDNFAPENELGRGGFGVVYKGVIKDGTKIAVKRMEGGVFSSNASGEFQVEITILSKVRHRHLVSLLGYCIKSNERLLVYEYMPQDDARGMEYLHTLAHQSFIHRDLKSLNILLGDDFRAKVADFGLVKLALDREKSVAARLTGIFGYLAPEYAMIGKIISVTGKITTKADVFSFGVVLMEILTGLATLDKDRSEENQYLAKWFWTIKSNREKLFAAIDPALEANEEIFYSICIIAELAGHCTARDPNHRPDMGYAVNVLAPLVENWKPFVGEREEEYSGIVYDLPLPELLKGWQEAKTKDFTSASQNDSKGSIPAIPTRFADSFSSANC
ncbi:hypothetical protein ACSBR1_021382 [Camellia fascicularis]